MTRRGDRVAAPSSRTPLLALAERAREEFVDGAASILFELARARAGDVYVGDAGELIAFEPYPVAVIPVEPGVLLLVEDVERLVAELGEFRAPAGAALDRFV